MENVKSKGRRTSLNVGSVTAAAGLLFLLSAALLAAQQPDAATVRQPAMPQEQRLPYPLARA